MGVAIAAETDAGMTAVPTVSNLAGRFGNGSGTPTLRGGLLNGDRTTPRVIRQNRDRFTLALASGRRAPAPRILGGLWEGS